MTVAYVWAKPNRYMQLLQLRNRLHDVIDTDFYYRKKKPHITLVPSFKINDGAESDIKSIVSSTTMQGSTVSVENIDVFKSIEQPFVIQLSVSLENPSEVSEMSSRLSDYSAVPINIPDNFHISLIKTRGCWDSVSQDVTERIQNELEYDPPFDTLNIERVKVSFKR